MDTFFFQENLPFTIYASDQKLKGFELDYGVNMSKYFEDNECTIELTVVQSEFGDACIAANEIYTNLLQHESRRGSRLILIDGRATRYTTYLGQLNPLAPCLRSFIPSSMMSYLTVDEFELLSSECKITNPETGKKISVLDISAMNAICNIYSSALRFGLLKNKKQIEAGILMKELQHQFTKEAISLKFKQLYNSEDLTTAEKIKLKSKPRSLIKPAKVFDEEFYESMSRVLGIDFDRSDSKRYQKSAVVMNYIKMMYNHFLDSDTQRGISQKKVGMSSNVRFANCLNAHTLAFLKLHERRIVFLANTLFEPGDGEELRELLDQFNLIAQ